MRTDGRFIIHTPCPEHFTISLQISRNLFQYFRADTEIVGTLDENRKYRVAKEKGNIISIEKGRAISPCMLPAYPITIDKERGIIIRNAINEHKDYELQEGIGAIFLRPLPNERLELLIWGMDDRGLHQAARLLPMLTGVGQPEFVIVSSQCAWQGAAGVLAMGSFDSFWELSAASYTQ